MPFTVLPASLETADLRLILVLLIPSRMGDQASRDENLRASQPMSV